MNCRKHVINHVFVRAYIAIHHTLYVGIFTITLVFTIDVTYYITQFVVIVTEKCKINF